MTGDSSVEDKGLQTIEAETQNLQSAVDQTVAGLSALNSNLTNAAKATSAIVVPSEINSSTGSMNIPEGLGEELNQMKQTINELNAKYAAMLEGMKN